ncbi:MAG: hypothetical protein Q8N31_00095 [Reyranella sp.]|nr:hypothetical protein [Reyranella sp.]MDP3158386.1 hypothetical protein [Reyranella sp.]
MRSAFMIATCLAILGGGTSVSAQSPSFTDPQAYCRAVGTIDGPDQRFTGAGVPDWIRAAFFTPEQIAAIKAGRQPDYGVAWRCVQGEVLACQNAQTPSCMKPDTDRTPTSAMREFCRRDVNAPVIPRVVTGTARMLAYDWVCRGPEPSIAKETPLDAQGFVAADWKRVNPN